MRQPSWPASVPISQGASLLDRAVDYALDSLRLVTPELMGRPTPCSDWNLRALLEHLDDAFLALSEAIETGRVDTEATDVPSGVPPLSRPDMPRTVSIAGLPLATGVVTAVGAIELTVHGWDVARACGGHRPIPRPLAVELLDVVPLFVTAADRTVRFAPPVLTGAGATPEDRLVAFLGRQP